MVRREKIVVLSITRAVGGGGIVASAIVGLERGFGREVGDPRSMR